MTEVILLALGPINAALVLDLAPAIVHLLGDYSRVAGLKGAAGRRSRVRIGARSSEVTGRRVVVCVDLRLRQEAARDNPA